MTEQLLSPPQAAIIAELHEDTVRRAIEFGYLQAQRVGRSWVIKPSDLQAWIEAGKPNHRRKSTRKDNAEESGTSDS